MLRRTDITGTALVAGVVLSLCLLASCGVPQEHSPAKIPTAEPPQKEPWVAGAEIEILKDWENCVIYSNAEIAVNYTIGETDYRHLGWACASLDHYWRQRFDTVLASTQREDGTTCMVAETYSYGKLRPLVYVSAGQCDAPLKETVTVSTAIEASIESVVCEGDLASWVSHTCLRYTISSKASVALYLRYRIDMPTGTVHGPVILLPGQEFEGFQVLYQGGHTSGDTLYVSYAVMTDPGSHVLGGGETSYTMP